MPKIVEIHVCQKCGPTAKLKATAAEKSIWSVNALGKKAQLLQRYEDPKFTKEPWICEQCGEPVAGEAYYEHDAQIPIDGWPGASRVIRYYVQARVPLCQMPKVYVWEPLGAESIKEIECTQDSTGRYHAHFKNLEWPIPVQ